MMVTRTDRIFEDIVETVREPLLVLDSDLKVILVFLKPTTSGGGPGKVQPIRRK